MTTNPARRVGLTPPPGKSHTLKRIKLLHVESQIQEPVSPLVLPTLPAPLKPIQPPPSVSLQFWDEEPSAEAEEHVFVTNEEAEETQSPLVPPYHSDGNGMEVRNASEDELATFDELSASPLEDLEYELEQDSFLLDDVELLDIDAALAEQELQQAEEEEKPKRLPRGQAPGWIGSQSLMYIQWEKGEEAIQEALDRLGYADIPLNPETRAFLIQAARAACLSHREELRMMARLVDARTRLQQLPLCEDPEDDPYHESRAAILSEINALEQTLMLCFQWVAIKKATQFLGHGIELEDLIQYGMLGVHAGIRHFDPARGRRLVHVVNIWVFQTLSRAVIDYGRLIRLPAHFAGHLDVLKRVHTQLQCTLERKPTRAELAEAANIPLERLNVLLADQKVCVSLECYRHAEYRHEGYSFQDVAEPALVAPDIGLEANADARLLIKDLLSVLTPKERQIICLRFGLTESREAQTLEAIGRQFQLTRERIRQLEQRAIEKMRGRICDLYGPQAIQVEKPRKLLQGIRERRERALQKEKEDLSING
uniref:RNA polymerase sigma-70 domain-containing protein n=1 Tax=Thermosporothrix sp. COM3 TaxID=2490863 RepID=A0A455SGH4_9CHLR|nr:hypothetical protein KTC_23040 [Thermosporothrix sp. COM3]